VDGPVGEVGEGGCDGEAHAGCCGVLVVAVVRYSEMKESEMFAHYEVCNSTWP
jgi:hypothetical protein